MIWLIWVLLALVICFGGVLLVGAPYLPTLSAQIEIALKLVDLKPGQTLLELGCGDGRVLLAAARKGANAIGYELNPLLALIAWLRTRRYSSQISVRWGNFWSANWPDADVIFVFLLDRLMPKLEAKINQYPARPLKLVSHGFKLTAQAPVKESQGVFLYLYK